MQAEWPFGEGDVSPGCVSGPRGNVKAAPVVRRRLSSQTPRSVRSEWPAFQSP